MPIADARQRIQMSSLVHSGTPTQSASEASFGRLQSGAASPYYPSHSRSDVSRRTCPGADGERPATRQCRHDLDLLRIYAVDGMAGPIRSDRRCSTWRQTRSLSDTDAQCQRNNQQCFICHPLAGTLQKCRNDINTYHNPQYKEE